MLCMKQATDPFERIFINILIMSTVNHLPPLVNGQVSVVDAAGVFQAVSEKRKYFGSFGKTCILSTVYSRRR